MQYTKELDLTTFEFWSGAKEHSFTRDELGQIEFILEDLFYEKAPTETQINDMFWFEEEALCEWAGIDYNEYLERE